MTKEGTVFLLPVCHLDTQWRWTVEETIRSFLPRTVDENARLFRQVPDYVVTFDGSFRYELLREYWPERFAELRRWVEAGRFLPVGSMVDAADVNLPSPESLVRHFLYGRRFFREELGVDTRDIFLPDCFGFGWHLPTVAAHCGITGFVTQKLRRGDWMRSAFGVPFRLGRWVGPDGSSVLAVLDPGGYGEPLTGRVDEDPELLEEVRAEEAASGFPFTVRFFGVGDKGGAPSFRTARNLERSLAGAGPLEVVTGGPTELFERLGTHPPDAWPTYEGELLLTRHATGCYTSQGAMKWWNRTNERLAEAAEKAAVVADWLGGAPYPAAKIRRAWKRVLWHQFHDDLTGTSVPEAYELSWNDEALSLNELSAVLRYSLGTVARALDTRAEAGAWPVVVFNPLSIDRTDVVEVRLRCPEATVGFAAVGPGGEPVPVQLMGRSGAWVDLLLLVEVPALGFTVVTVRSERSRAVASDLVVQREALDGQRLSVALDRHGDLARCLDRALGRDLLAGPCGIELFADPSARFPAWEIDEESLRRPVARVAGPADVRVVEEGPVRCALEVRRRHGGSSFVQRYRLAAGAAGDRLEVQTAIDWRSRGRLAKAVFPLGVSAPRATYDLGVGVIERGVSSPRLYEVPAQEWVDVTDPGGDWGVAVVSGQRQGWDRPRPDLLRLTLVRTPRTGRRFRHQGWADLGHHDLGWAIGGHRGDWRSGVRWLAARVTQPLMAASVEASDGPLGRRFALLRPEGDQALVRTVKMAEQGSGLVVRLQELHGTTGALRLEAATPIRRLVRLDGVEDEIGGDAEPESLGLEPHRPVTVGLELGGPEEPLAAPTSRAVILEADTVVSTRDRETAPPGRRWCLPAELLPTEVVAEGIRFELQPGGDGRPTAACFRGQAVTLDAPPDSWLGLLVAREAGSRRQAIVVDGEERPIDVPELWGFVGQSDRVARRRPLRIVPGFAESVPVAWVATHRHDRWGRDVPYRFGVLYRLVVPLPEGGEVLRLPQADGVLLFAASIATNRAEAAVLTLPSSMTPRGWREEKA